MDSFKQCVGLRPSNDGRYFRCFNGADAPGCTRCSACLAFRQPASAVEGGPVHRCGHPKKTGDGGPCRSAVEHPGMLCVHHHLQADAQPTAAATRQGACCGRASSSSDAVGQTTIHRFFKPIR